MKKIKRPINLRREIRISDLIEIWMEKGTTGEITTREEKETLGTIASIEEKFINTNE